VVPLTGDVATPALSYESELNFWSCRSVIEAKAVQLRLNTTPTKNGAGQLARKEKIVRFRERPYMAL
jgi:hypothetical protein